MRVESVLLGLTLCSTKDGNSKSRPSVGVYMLFGLLETRPKSKYLAALKGFMKQISPSSPLV